MSWKPGDVVRLKGQAVPMTVFSDQNDATLEVYYFDRNGVLREASVFPELLEECAGAGESRYADIQGSLGVRGGSF